MDEHFENLTTENAGRNRAMPLEKRAADHFRRTPYGSTNQAWYNPQTGNDELVPKILIPTPPRNLQGCYWSILRQNGNSAIPDGRRRSVSCWMTSAAQTRRRLFGKANRAPDVPQAIENPKTGIFAKQ
jgi:hypothetical protein